jgi:hypothetical protein
VIRGHRKLIVEPNTEAKVGVTSEAYGKKGSITHNTQ